MIECRISPDALKNAFMEWVDDDRDGHVGKRKSFAKSTDIVESWVQSHQYFFGTPHESESVEEEKKQTKDDPQSPEANVMSTSPSSPSSPAIVVRSSTKDPSKSLRRNF
jgi:hypothetical protein